MVDYIDIRLEIGSIEDFENRDSDCDGCIFQNYNVGHGSSYCMLVDTEMPLKCGLDTEKIYIGMNYLNNKEEQPLSMLISQEKNRW